MAVMKVVEEIKRDIETKHLKPFYVLDGEEPYYIDLVCNYFEENLLTASEKDFNLTILYGKDTDKNTVMTVCKRYPMFADKQVVILKEAAQLKNFNDLEPYFLQPLPSTVFVVAHKFKKIDGRSTVLKTIKKNGFYTTFEPIKEYQLVDWILQYCTENRIKITPYNADKLAVYLGNDLQKIVNELKKIFINIPADAEVTEELIEQYIGISKEYNVFEYPQAILDKNREKTFRIIKYFEANPKDAPLVLLTVSLYNKFQTLYLYHYAKHLPQKELATHLRIHPYFIKDFQKSAQLFPLPQTIEAIKIIQQYNLQSIGIDVAHGNHHSIKDLTFKLLNL